MTETLEALKITRGILLKSIVDLETQIAEIEKPEPKKWEPRGGDWFVGDSGEIDEKWQDEICEFGNERDTREQAEKAAIEMRRFNRLLAYRDEFAPGYVRPIDGKSYFVYFDSSLSRWMVDFDYQDCEAITVYMPKNVAVGLEIKLNSGEVVL